MIGIIIEYSSSNTLTNNTANSNNEGIYFVYSSSNTLTNNTANSNNWDGISILGSSNNILINSTAKENNDYDIYIAVYYTDAECNNVVINTIGSGDRPIKYFNSSISLQNEILSELILCNADNSNINNVTIEGSTTKKNNALVAIKTDYSNFANITSSNNNIGIFLYSSSSNTLTNNTANSNDGVGNGMGIMLSSSSSNNILINNTANSNNYGIYLYPPSNNNTLTNNNANSNNYGIYLGPFTSNNTLTNNIFNNTNNFGFWEPNVNTWNTTKQSGTNIIGGPYLGGNFWAHPNGTGFSQTCADVDRDGICDSAYVLDTNNIDYLPLTLPYLRFINGTVMDSLNRTGIQGVKVSTNTGNSTTTNTSGFYSFAVSSGTYNITATFEPTYYSNTTTVSTTSSAVVLHDIELIKKPTGNITGSVTNA